MPTRLIALLACAALAFPIAACGGEESEPEAEAPAGATEQTTTEAAPTTTEAAPTTTDEAEEPAAGGTTKPGTTLGLGETAHVTRKPLNAPFDSKTFYKIDVAALKIDKGTIGDFANVNLDEEQKESTPYYVTVRITNTGSKVPADEDPVLGFDAVDDRGQKQGRLIIIGTFDRCDYAEIPKPFNKGKSYESCLIFLMPGGGSIEEVQWSGADEYFSDPIVWK
jgi:hypothetical protein